MNKKKMITSTMLILSMTLGGLVGCSNQTTTNPTTQNVKKKVTLGKKKNSDEKADETESSIESKSEIASTETGNANASSNNSSTSTSNKTSSTASTSSNSNKNNSSSSSTSSNSNSSSQHTHNWVAQTKTVHHEATYTNKWVIDSAAYDEQFPEYEMQEQTICNTCGANLSSLSESGVWEHVDSHWINDGVTSGYHSTAVSVLVGYKTIHHDEVGHNERVLVKDAYDETITTGYKCSTCGKTK